MRGAGGPPVRGEGGWGPAAALGHPAAQLRGGGLPGQRGPRGVHPAGHAARPGASRPRRGPRGRHRTGRRSAPGGPQAGQRRDRDGCRRRPGRPDAAAGRRRLSPLFGPNGPAHSPGPLTGTAGRCSPRRCRSWSSARGTARCSRTRIRGN